MEKQDLDSLTEMARKQIALEDAVERKEAELKHAKASLREFCEKTLPGRMIDDLDGLTEVGTQAGKIKVTNKVYGNIKKDDRPAAHKHITDLGSGHLVRHKVTLDFGPNQANMVKNLTEYLREQGYEFSDTESVNAAQLHAFVRRMLSEGEEIDMDLLGVRSVNVSEITRPDD